MEFYVELFRSVPELFNFYDIFWLMVGVSIGIFFGLMPGLAGPQALALMLPLTYSLDFVPALFLLIGIAGSATCAGSVTSILLGVPGTPVNAATVLDGYPLAKQGKAGLAIGAAGTSSGLGGIFGAIVLMILLPFGFQVVLLFSYAEFFMLATVGICAIALSTEGTFLKGLISGFLGILLTTVGFDPFLSYPRFAYGQLFLWDGFSVLSILIGLFAITEAMALFIQGESIASNATTRVVGVIDGIKTALRHYKIVLRSSIIGVVVGLMPGVGGSLAQFLAYGATVSSAKDKSEFGKGDIRGIIGAEASNNAKDGGSLVPTLLFGIPGSLDTAILLGAFMIHGITPGLILVNRYPEVLFTVIWVLVASTVLSVIISFLAGPYLVKLTTIKGPIIGICVIVLSILGTYAASRRFSEIIIILVFGLLGYYLKKHGFSRTSLIIGFLLGSIVESNLRQGLATYGLVAFFSRPISLTILILGIIMIYFNIRSTRKGKQEVA